MIPVIRYLTEAHRRNRLPHAILFLGNSHQKLLFSFLVARGLSCIKPASETLFGCGKCETCCQFSQGTPINLQWVNSDDENPDSPLSVAEVKVVKRENNLHGFNEGPRIAILPFGHRLTQSAANAFLKTLEEPGANRYIFILAPTQHSVLPTISSRCQKVFCPAESFIPAEQCQNIQLPDHLKGASTDSGVEHQDTITNNIHERIDLISKLPNSREQALNYVATLIAALRANRLNISQPATQQWLEHALQSHARLLMNANPTLVLESLLLKELPLEKDVA